MNEEMSEEMDYRRLIASMQDTLRRKVKARNITYTTEDDLRDEIFEAIQAVNERRRFEPTSSIPFEEKYSSLIVKLALSSIAKYGAEGEKSHSENGINRVYDNASEYPESLMSRIVPLAKAR